LRLSWNESRLRRWAKRKRHDPYDKQGYVVLSLWPRVLNSGAERQLFWLTPIRKHFWSTSWKPTWCLDTGYSSHFDYEEPREGDWGVWLRTRPVHYLAGLVGLLTSPFFVLTTAGIIALAWWFLHVLNNPPPIVLT